MTGDALIPASPYAWAGHSGKNREPGPEADCCPVQSGPLEGNSSNAFLIEIRSAPELHRRQHDRRHAMVAMRASWNCLVLWDKKAG
jgi:hypothetical protein